jgi:hypothetical protein
MSDVWVVAAICALIVLGGSLAALVGWWRERLRLRRAARRLREPLVHLRLEQQLLRRRVKPAHWHLPERARRSE